LLPIDPAGHQEKEELELCVPGQQRTVEAPRAQASTLLNPNCLPLQANEASAEFNILTLRAGQVHNFQLTVQKIGVLYRKKASRLCV
jgi:hypothetical protein